MNLDGKISLDELLADPGRALGLPRSVRNDLLARCAALIVTLATAEEESAQTATVSEDRLLTVQEAAPRLGISTSTLYREADKYDFTVRQGESARPRFSSRGIDRYIQRRQGLRKA
jgi:predicted DNA-binding transcriptional regulator AlpA